MKSQQKQNHVIDFLFPIVLFFIFTISAVVVILLATKIYESTTTASSMNNVSHTALSYVSEKIHQSDCLASVSITKLDGVDALTLRHINKKDGYTTYIYYYEGVLKELFIKNGITASLSAGNSIATVADFQMQQLEDGLLRFTCVDTKGQNHSIIVGLHSALER